MNYLTLSHIKEVTTVDKGRKEKKTKDIDGERHLLTVLSMGWLCFLFKCHSDGLRQ